MSAPGQSFARWCVALSACVLACACGDGTLSVVDDSEPGRSPGLVEPDAGASSGTGLTVLSPLSGDLLTSELVQVRGTAIETALVVVNGKEVEVVDGAFEVTVVLPEGDQTIVADGEGHVPVFVPVVVDARAPHIALTSPARGTFLVAGESDVIDVKGIATDTVTRVESVLINGQPVQIGPEGSFAAQVAPQAGGNLVVVEAVDAAGHKGGTTRGVVYGQYAPWTSRVKDGIDMRLQAAAIPIMERGFADALLLSMSTDLGGGGGGEVEVEGVSVESVEVDLIPRQGYFDTTITINQMRIDAVVEQEILFITTDVDATITIDRAIVRTQLYISPNPGGGLTTQMQGSDVQMQGFDLDLDGIFSLVEGFAQDYVEETTLEMFRRAVAGGDAADEGPAQIPVDLLGQSEMMTMYFTRFDIDPAGFGFAGDMAMDVPADPSMPPSPGFLTTPGAPPPNDGFSQMVRFSMADDLFNYMLGTIWNAGLLNSTVADSVGDEGALTAGTFALLVGSQLLEHASPSASVAVRTSALLPPVARFTPDGPHDMEVVMADTMLEFRVLEAGFDPLTFATVAASFLVYVDCVFVDGQLTTEVTTTTVADLDSEPLFDIDDERFEQVIAGLVENLPAALGDETQVDPAPDAALINGAVLFDGAGRDFMSVYTDVQ